MQFIPIPNYRTCTRTSAQRFRLLLILIMDIDIVRVELNVNLLLLETRSPLWTRTSPSAFHLWAEALVDTASGQWKK